jgi:hypothetical protein
MSSSDTPKAYEEWRTAPIDRAEDAAYTFGYHLIQHCRNDALKDIATSPLHKSAEELQAQVTTAVDTALHSVMDLLEGFWPTQAGPNHRVAYALAVCVSDLRRAPVERIDISPCLVDLPIGYWKFKDGEYQ